MKMILLSKELRLVSFIIVVIAFFSTCINTNQKEIRISNESGQQFAGSAKCENCHREVYQNFIKTAHAHTSQPASGETILGSFKKGVNVFSYSYYSRVAMEYRDSGLYQVEYDKNFREKQKYRFDIIIGSGTRGQSYLSWVNNGLIQLPVSFFTAAGTWANSPGFPEYQPLFKRTISGRCLECHSTYFKITTATNNSSPDFDRSQVLFGVQCESCHGPANDHVVYHEQHQEERKGKFIINPSSFTRQQKLDVCGFCHGGLRENEKQPFTFSPGDTLSHFLKQDTSTVSADDVEVHGNQYGLLTNSRCFKVSGSMSCNTCHNTHNEERGNLAVYSNRCMTCHDNHTANFCKMAPTLGDQIKSNCIDCHMPEKKSKMLDVKLAGKNDNMPSILRSHFIAIYRDETNKYLQLHK